MISQRLQVIAGLVQPHGVVVDVGCDHGYLCCYLLDKYQDIKCIACDISQACLAKVIDRDRLSKRLGDGLYVLDVYEKVHTIVIAGMGGNLMCDILESYFERIKEVEHDKIDLILSPQSDVHKVRALLAKYGCVFVCDFVLLDCGKFYDIIKCEYKGVDVSIELTRLQLKYGVYYQVYNQALSNRLNTELNVYTRALQQSSNKTELQSKIDDIREVLTWQQ